MNFFYIPLIIGLFVFAGGPFNAAAQTETNLYFFGSVPNDLGYPVGLVQGRDGNFYGIAGGGSGTHYLGGVFRISASGSYTNLYSFGSVPNDGENPVGALVQGNDGNFYSTTEGGGAYSVGTIFRISASGSYTNLYSFGLPHDGESPNGTLIQGSDGNFYGTTEGGGAHSAGTIFRISASVSYTNLYSFGTVSNDGTEPQAGLAQGNDGNFYGTTTVGGTLNDGAVFRISASGGYTNIYYFGSAAGSLANHWQSPLGAFVLGTDGNFYGTTQGGGTYSAGTIFRMTATGNYTNLYSFGSVSNDGNGPSAGLVLGSDGNFYGTTLGGGAHGVGTIFQFNPNGSYAVLYSFGSVTKDGTAPQAGLAQGVDGNFYGTTSDGGPSFGNYGSVYKMTVSLSPPANQISNVQMATTNFIFTVPSVAGETYQLQYQSTMTSVSWSNVPGASVTNSIGSLLTLTNTFDAAQPQGFYRVVVTP